MASSGFGVLSADLQTPMVTETTVRSDSLKTGEIVTKSLIEVVGNSLGVGSITVILLSIEKPLWNSELERIGDNFDELGHFVGADFSGTRAMGRSGSEKSDEVPLLVDREKRAGYRLLVSISAALQIW